MTSIEGKTIQAPVTRIMSSHPGWQVLRYLVAAILLVAAVSKSYMLSTTPTMGDGILDNRLFQIAVVNFEIALSVWLIAGLMPGFSWLVTLACFSVFAAVSASKFFEGAESCHCFGAITTPPIFTLSLDLAVIGLLIAFRPKGLVLQRKAFLQELPELKRSGRLGLVAVVWLLLAIPATYAMMSVEKNDLAELGTEFIGADGKKTILLQPDKWVGKKLPILPYIESETQQPHLVANEFNINIERGDWNFLLYKAGCYECIIAIDKMIADKTPNLVCVNITPSIDQIVLPNDCINAQLNESRYHWFAQTPLLVAVHEGMCICYD